MTKREKKQSSTYRFPAGVSRAVAVLSACVLALVFSSCATLIRPPEAPPEAAVWLADPFMGDWEGSCLTIDGDGLEIVAQVIALGEGKYQATFLEEFDTRTTSNAVLEGRRSGKVAHFQGKIEAGEYSGIVLEGLIEGDNFTGTFEGPYNGTFEMKKVVHLSPTLGKEPPAGAVVLFDASNFDQWVHAGINEGQPVQWQLLEGAMEVVPGTPDIVSKQKFTDFELHVEFRTPFMPAARDQKRGNSGVYLQGRYEVQVLDSYGLEGQDNECGGIYKVGAPLVNMCAPPMQWQTYDMTFYAPRFDEDGNKTENARLTVLHNGVKIHENIEIPEPTGSAQDRVGEDVSQPGGISLQEHGNRVQYRNIWLVELP